MFAVPVAANNVDSAGVPTHASADHVVPADCDVITTEGEQIFVNGVAVSAEDLAVMQLELLGGALRLAAAAAGSDASVCIDVTGLPGSPTGNGHIDLCGTVDADPDVGVDIDAVVTVGGVALPEQVLVAGSVELFLAADAAGTDACLSVRVADSRMVIETSTVEPICATATLNARQELDVVIGGAELQLAVLGGGTVVDPSGVLEVAQPVSVRLEISVSADYHTHGHDMIVTVIGEGCEPTPPQPTASPTGRGATTGELLPDTAMRDAAPSSTGVALLLLVLSLVGMYRHARSVRTAGAGPISR